MVYELFATMMSPLGSFRTIQLLNLLCTCPLPLTSWKSIEDLLAMGVCNMPRIHRYFFGNVLIACQDPAPRDLFKFVKAYSASQGKRKPDKSCDEIIDESVCLSDYVIYTMDRTVVAKRWREIRVGWHPTLLENTFGQRLCFTAI